MKGALLALLLSGVAPVAARDRPEASDAYDVVAAEGTLNISARFLPPVSGCLTVDDAWAQYVIAPEVERPDGWHALGVRGRCFDVPEDPGPTHIRYRFLLSAAASPNRRGDAWERQGVLFSRPSVWLIRPAGERRGTFVLNVTPPRSLMFAAGLETVDAHYQGRTDFIDRLPYSLLGPVRTRSIEKGGGRIKLALAPGDLAVSENEIASWAERAAEAVVAYMGVYPLPEVLVAVVPSGGNRVGYGSTWGYGGASIVISVGAHASRSDLLSDWELTHEMVHLTLPNLPRAQHWMEEGLATYVEPLARCRAGQLGVEEVWRENVTQLPLGLPHEGDRGLDVTQTWASTYWGGALYWFLVDLDLRERTHGRLGLADLLRGLHEEGADIRIEWGVEDLLKAAQRITGTDVLRERYRELALAPGRPDLDRIWSRLGVKLVGREVQFDDEAPGAPVRRAMTGLGKPSE
jgi:hypothetical protein